MEIKNILIVSKKTSLDYYKELFPKDTKENIIKNGIEDYSTLEAAHISHYSALKKLENELKNLGINYKVALKQKFISKDFDNTSLVIALGGDGTFLDVAKLVRNQLFLGIRSDSRSHGYLMSADASEDSYESKGYIKRILEDKFKTEKLVRLRLGISNGRKIEDFAVNEIYIGHKFSSGMARYTLSYRGKEEKQMSSGVVIATGAGSTAWYSNIYCSLFWKIGLLGKSFSRDEEKLKFVVISPNRNGINICTIKKGIIQKNDIFKVKSNMNFDGCISVDGSTKERMYEFNRGSIANVSVGDSLKIVKF